MVQWWRVCVQASRLEFSSQSPSKKLIVMSHACDPKSGEVKAGRASGLSTRTKTHRRARAHTHIHALTHVCCNTPPPTTTISTEFGSQWPESTGEHALPMSSEKNRFLPSLSGFWLQEEVPPLHVIGWLSPAKSQVGMRACDSSVHGSCLALQPRAL